jgi:acyl carrier protein
MSTLMAQILSIIERALDKAPQTLDPDAAMDETQGWDSLKTMEIVVAIERHFQTTFSAQQMMSMDSANSIYEALAANGVGQG